MPSRGLLLLVDCHLEGIWTQIESLDLEVKARAVNLNNVLIFDNQIVGVKLQSNRFCVLILTFNWSLWSKNT